MCKHIILYVLFFYFVFATQSFADESPDELYRKGRYSEAEKLYTQKDMDHPQDIRYRYNRGCAAYQNSDFQGAHAAFSSAFRRAKDTETRYRASYNSGNAAFKQGNFEVAVAYYKNAILLNPESEEARYNMELALNKLEKQKRENEKKQQSPSHDDSGQAGDQKNQKKEQSEKPSGKNEPDDTSHAKPEKKKDASGKKEGQDAEKSSKSQQEQPQDLTGELSPLHDLPKKEEGDTPSGSHLPQLDKKKAEALLDNIQEDRSQFLRFQIPKDKTHGALSGKDW